MMGPIDVWDRSINSVNHTLDTMGDMLPEKEIEFRGVEGIVV